ncbi:MAG: molybdopterin-dependent oxidoreductase [Chloroflexi bacterium]|nr:molybdopterin-dependent oxidoreductase [Chloroflexota bacterium]MYC47343.1 molybdopterin-dependent oxidoreductase [Chloroflexota bacterium]
MHDPEIDADAGLTARIFAAVGAPWAMAGLTGLLAGGLVTSLYFPLFELGWMANPAFDFVDLLIRFSPGQLATWSIETLGPLGKTLLEASGLATWILATGVLSALVYRFAPQTDSLAQRSLLAGAIFLVAQLTIELLAELSFYGLGGIFWLVAAAALYGYLSQAYAPLPAPAAESVASATWPPPRRSGWLQRRSRRELLALSAATAVAGSFGAIAAQRGILASRAEPPSPEPVAIEGFDSDFMQAANTRPLVTSNEDFYRIDIYTRTPTFARSNWSMQVGGMVDRELSFSIDDIERLPMQEMYGTLQCISNEVGGELISTTRWTGVPLAEFLDLAGLQPGARDVVFHAPGGYDDSIPIEKALEPTTLLTYGMNGQPLPAAHGFPLRAYIPNIYGMKNVKWITRIEVTDRDHEGYWQRRGWSDIAIIKATSAWDLAGRRRTGRVQVGEDIIGGIAFAGNRGISAVEWRRNDSDVWTPAELEDQLNETTWRRWKANLGLDPGTYFLEVRAFDGAGDPQPEKRTPTHPDGAGGYHLIQLAVVE